MKRISGLIAMAIALNGYAQNTTSVTDSLRRDSIRRVTQQGTQQDYKKMLDLLHIEATRPGPSGNPQAPNAANTDESKASPYTTLPDPLILKNGKKVTTAKIWFAARRPEI